MKSKSLSVFILVLVAGVGLSEVAHPNAFSVSQLGSSFEATYTADISFTVNGNKVTSVVILEKDSVGDVKLVNFRPLKPGGVSVLSDTLNFLPTSALILGVDLSRPIFGTGKRDLVMFVNDDFAASAVGHQFRDVFPQLNEQTLIKTLLSAYKGDENAQTLLQSYFTDSPLSKAAFGPGEFSVTEWTLCQRIDIRQPCCVPEPSTMLLLSSGLIGLAGYGRKKFFKK